MGSADCMAGLGKEIAASRTGMRRFGCRPGRRVGLRRGLGGAVTGGFVIRAAGALVIAAGTAGTAWPTGRRAMRFEFFERHFAVAVLVHRLEDLLGFRGIFLRPGAGLELVEAERTVVVCVEVLEYFLGVRAFAPRAAGTAGTAGMRTAGRHCGNYRSQRLW